MELSEYRAYCVFKGLVFQVPQKKEVASWFKCEIWRGKGKLEKILSLLKKGSKIWVDGKPECDVWQKDEELCGMVKCKVENLEIF